MGLIQVWSQSRPTVISDGLEYKLEFEEFFRAEYLGLVRTLYLMIGNLMEAEDLVQEAMARTFERWDRVQRMDSPSGYVYQIAVNLNRRKLRRLARRAQWLLTPAPPRDFTHSVDARRDLADSLSSLPSGQREALILVEWVGMDAEQAGRMLGIRPASVRSRVHRARLRLREKLEAYHE